MNKYYTPTSDEFHLGFRYETMWGVEGIDEEWLVDIWEEDSCLEYLKDIKTRVKHLDREDIEELGWFFVEENIFKLPSKSGFDSRFGSTPHLELLENNVVLITLGFSSYMGVPQGVIFKGKIKNYNELKFQMKRIGINE